MTEKREREREREREQATKGERQRTREALSESTVLYGLSIYYIGTWSLRGKSGVKHAEPVHTRGCNGLAIGPATPAYPIQS